MKLVLIGRRLVFPRLLPVGGRRGHRDIAGQVQRGHITLRPGAASREEASFAEGLLAWRDAPVSRVVADLRRWYGVTLVVRDSAMSQRHLTASFHGESADQALRIVATALGGDLRRKGDSAIVSGPAGGRTRP